MGAKVVSAPLLVQNCLNVMYVGQRHPSNPIVPEEPRDLTVTGFRDPYLASWNEMDAFLSGPSSSSTPTNPATKGSRALYALLSGGTPAGPNIFLYKVEENDLTKWIYLGPLFDLPPHHRLTTTSPKLTFKDDDTFVHDPTCLQPTESDLSSEYGSTKTPKPLLSNGKSRCAPADPNYSVYPETISGGATPWIGHDLGCNWECATFATLRDVKGSEHTVFHEQNPQKARRTPRGANWMFGKLIPSQRMGPEHANQPLDEENSLLRIRERRLEPYGGLSKQPLFSPSTSGLLDHGLLYACTLFSHPDGRTVLWGWLIEDDVSPDFLAEKGWTGCLGVPREIFLLPIDGAKSALRTPIDQLNGFQWDAMDGLTLGIRPLSELAQLRTSLLVDSVKPSSRACLLKTSPAEAHLDIEIDANMTPNSIFMLHLKHNAEMSLRTTVIFSAITETISVDRSASTRRTDINTMMESGRFTLFCQAGRSDRSEQSYESFKLRVLMDGDVLEVFANDRFALSTRSYTPSVGCGGISVETKGPCVVESAKVWKMGSIGLV